jgi:2-polyprenyl-6-methoxyphenol hydroxylase-like FAD-dependent oxidoreductase
MMATAAIPEAKPAGPQLIEPAQDAACCIVGGGPGGMMLALFLARAGVKVTLLEAHKDFDREFRGDTLHPSILEILDQMGLTERLHQLPHNKIYGPTFQSSGMSFSPIDFRRLNTKFPYIMLVPQKRFLEFLAAEAKKYPNFRLRMVANAGQLMEGEQGVEGVRYQSTDGWHEVRAPLTVGADGRFSKIRQLAGFAPIKTSPPMDILWFQLPHLPHDEHSERVMGGFGNGRLLAVFDRIDYWQIGYVFPKGQYQQVRAAGLEAFRRSIVEIEPSFANHVEALKEWHQCSLLSVESSRCPVWYKPGLLLIGDAAHVMSPVGGVGINYAVQDAVVAANVLTEPLRSSRVRVEELAEVQRQREWPTRVMQAIQSTMQTRMIASALQTQGTLRIPWLVRFFFKVPVLRDVPARVLAFGVRRVRLQRAD